VLDQVALGIAPSSGHHSCHKADIQAFICIFDDGYSKPVDAALLLALISPVVAVGIAVWGFRRTGRADRLKAFFEMHDRYLAPEMRAGRRLLHQQVANRSTDEIAALDAEVRSIAGHTLAVMNSIAIACDARYVDRSVVTASMGRSFANAMAAAAPFVDYVEGVRGFRPYGYAERLAAEIVKTTRTPVSLPDGLRRAPASEVHGHDPAR
jgi:hypothetical protein